MPQKRKRVFIVGFRDYLDINWSFPEPTHTLEALIYQKWVTGEYWERHQIDKSRRPEVPEKICTYLQLLLVPTFLEVLLLPDTG